MKGSGRERERGAEQESWVSPISHFPQVANAHGLERCWLPARQKRVQREKREKKGERERERERIEKERRRGEVASPVLLCLLLCVFC